MKTIGFTFIDKLQKERPAEKKERGKLLFSDSADALSAEEKMKFLILCGMAYLAIAYLFYHSWLLALLGGSLAWPSLRFYRSYREEKRKREMLIQFRDVLYSFSSSFSAGRQMPEALREAEAHLRMIYRPDAVMIKELNHTATGILESRAMEADLLNAFAQRSQLEDIDNFIDIYLTCRKTGGDLVNMVAKASEIILEKISIEQEIYLLTAQKRLEVKILTSIPIVMILFLHLASPDYLSVLYTGISGRLLMTLALGGIGGSYLWSMKLIDIRV